MFYQGLKDGIKGKSALSEADIQTVMTKFQEGQISKIKKQRQDLAVANMLASKKFFSTNKNQPGIKSLPSGLQYKVIAKGKGKNPTLDDIVTVHYKGTLLNGTEFDSSYKRKGPSSFPLKNVIKGWQEGIQLMKAGSKIKLFIPPELAYGEQGAGKFIGPNSALIFDVELLKIGK